MLITITDDTDVISSLFVGAKSKSGFGEGGITNLGGRFRKTPKKLCPRLRL